MIMGGGGRVSRVWVRVWRERKKGENRVFHAKERIYNMQILLSEFVSLRKIQLLVLSMTFCVKRNFSAC